MSPTVLAVPAMQPNGNVQRFFALFAGRTSTSGTPRFVTVTGRPVRRTSFMIRRHCALNFAAPTFVVGVFVFVAI